VLAAEYNQSGRLRRKTVSREFAISSISEVLDAALALNAEERAEVVHNLLLSLEPVESDSDVDEAWAHEIQRRRQAIREGTTTLRDWGDALDSIRKSLDAEGRA
jgi:hypothetical protein